MQVLKNSLVGLQDGTEFDLVVIGAGGAGLSAAVFAAIEGAKVLVVARTEYVGGTTAWSAGTTWVPGTHHAAQVNASDTLTEARTYLNHAVGTQAPAELREAFLKHGGEAVAKIEAQSSMRYRPYPKHPDYISDLPGSTLSGRALEPVPFDGRLLHSLAQHDQVTLALKTSVDALERDAHGRVVAVCFSSASGNVRVMAKRGVVLASGGFNLDPVLRAQKLSGLWAPVSLRKRADGSTAVFPHFVMDRAKPGMITVNQAG